MNDEPEYPAEEQEDTESQTEEIPSAESQEEEVSAREPSEQEDGADVKLSEEFQKKVTPIIEEANRHELEFMRSLIMEREKELMHAETKGEKSGTFDMGGMPED